ncbi:hypothetical protein DL770_008591 [Monosporascus sp. CRB-9-2]|nr:hypothetical protein DL770_008591 [Monosporascus sp. CRB-9-2]
MYRAATGRARTGGAVFAEVPQTDGDEDDGPPYERRTPTQFRLQVQSILRQGNLGGGPGTESLHSSPELPDTTLLSGGYLEAHDDEYPEADIGDYAEYGEYYGPQAINVSPTKSLKAGLGIEVRPVTETSDGLYVDDPLTDISYKGSEGNIEEFVPRETPNYRPLVLRKRFLLVLITALAMLLGLTELAVHLLPDASKAPGDADGQDATLGPLRSRSSHMGSAGDDGLAGVLLQGRQNEHPGVDDDTNSLSPVPPTEETPAIPTESLDTTLPTVVQPPQETHMTQTSNMPSTQVTETSAKQQPTIPPTTEGTTVADLPTAPDAPTTTDVPTIPENPPFAPSDTSNPGTTTTVEPTAPLPTETTTETPDAPKSNTEVEAPSTSTPKPSQGKPTLTDTETSQPPPPPTSNVPSTQEPTKTGDPQPPDAPETSLPPGTSQPTKILEPPDNPEPTTSVETTDILPPVATQDPDTTTTEETKPKPPVETQPPPHTEKLPEPTTSIKTTDSPPPVKTEEPETTTTEETKPKPPVETQPPPHTEKPPEPTTSVETTGSPPPITTQEPEITTTEETKPKPPVDTQPPPQTEKPPEPTTSIKITDSPPPPVETEEPETTTKEPETTTTEKTEPKPPVETQPPPAETEEPETTRKDSTETRPPVETQPPPHTDQPPVPTTSIEITENPQPPVETEEPETTTTGKTGPKPPVETQPPPHTEKPPEPTTSIKITDSPPPPVETEEPGTTTTEKTKPKPPGETQPPPHTDQPPEPTSTIGNTAIPSKEPELSILPVDMPGTSRTPTDSPAPTESPALSDPTQPQPTKPQPTEPEQPPKPTQGEPSQGPPSEGRPTTQQPTSEQPTQGKPTADPPNTERPGTEQPTAERPNTQQSTIQQPTTQLATTQAPTQAPTTQRPISGQPATEKPTADKSTTEQPNSEHPTQGRPNPDRPAHEKPTEGQPAQVQSTLDQPTLGQPSQKEPTQGPPTQGPPTTTGPFITQPTTSIAPESPLSSKPEGSLEPSPSPQPPGTSIPSMDGPSARPLSNENPTGDRSGPPISGMRTLSSTGIVFKEQSGLTKPPSPPETTAAAEASEAHEAGAVSATEPGTQDVDPFSDLEPFTTLVLTEDTSTNAHPEVTALGTSVSDDDDYPRLTTTTSLTREFDFGNRLLQSALTLYTPTDVGGPDANPIWAYRTLTTTVETDSNGRPTRTQTWAILYEAQKTTLTDYQGRPTRTLTYYVVPYETTLYDGLGRPTATTTIDVTQVPTTRTLRDGNGIATRTITEMVPISSTTVLVVTATPTNTADPGSIDPESAMHVSDAQYFLVLMLPTLVAISLAIPMRILNRTAKLYQPFHAMTSHRGARASESLCLDTTGPRSLLTGIRSASRGHILPSLTGTLVLASAVLVPLSGGVAHLRLEGPDCVIGNGTATDCAMAVAILPNTARAVIGILAFMLALACIAVAVLWRWRTGVVQSRSFQPWSLRHMAHLGTNPDIQLLLGRLRKSRKITADSTIRTFGGRSFVLEYWKDNGVLKYGILISNEVGQPLRKDPVKSVMFASRGPKGHRMPFFLLTFLGRVMLLSFLCAVLISVLVYNITGERRRGMIGTGESLGIRTLFTAIGVSITFVWDSFFYSVASVSPFRLLNRRDQRYEQEAMQTAPPTSVFGWVASTLRRRRRDFYLGIVAAAGIFVELLPLILSNVPFEARRSYPGFEPCTWMSVIVLCLMIFVVIGSFLVRWPHMAIDPTSLAGLLYYALDPQISSSVTGRSPSGGALFGRVDTPDV